MNKKKINRFIIIIILILIANIIYFQFAQDKLHEKGIITYDDDTQKDYDNIGINPNAYEKIEDFLSDSEIFSKSFVDVSKDNFVICGKGKDGNISYTPFYQADIKAGLFSEKSNKNLAIIDIYKSSKNKCLFGGYGSTAGNKIIFEEDIAHSDTYILNSIFSRKSNINDFVKELEKVPNQSISKKELLGYLYDFKGDYSKANDKRKSTCKENSITCDKKVSFNLNGKILDETGEALSGVKITLLNNNKIFTVSDEKGNYSLDFKYYPFSHLRFKANLNQYSDGFQTVSFNNYKDLSWAKTENLDFVLNKADYSYIIDVNSDKNKIFKNGKQYFEFKTKQSIYHLPLDGLSLKNGSKWSGNKFEVYLYELTKWDNTDNLTNIDTFNEVSGYVGNLMKTFGMPYVQFIDYESKQELFVKKSNPMILQNSIYHMKELYDNYDKIYEPITDEDMEFLVSYSKEKGGYPINFQFLTEKNFLRWPAWWVLDRKKGIWESVGSRVLTVEGLVELPFYSINDL